MSDQNSMNIREHMEVIGQDGSHVGTVDKVEGNMIKLTKNDSEAGGRHHMIPMDVVSHVDEHVHLMIPAEQAMREWEGDYPEGESGSDNNQMDGGGINTSADQPA